MSSSIPKKQVRRATHARIAEIIIWAVNNKESIQARIAKGTFLEDFAKDHGIHPQSMKGIFTSVGITLRERSKSKPPPADSGPVIPAMLTVLARICRDLNAPHDELKPFLTTLL